ncbi:DUF4395 family protein [Streptomyces sp. NPDC003401]
MDIAARGPRSGAAVTTVVPAVAPITRSPWPPARQTPAFALGAVGGVGEVGAVGGVGRSPYGWAFRAAVRPKPGPPGAFEAPQPARFAQAVGLVFAGLGLIGLTLGPQWLGLAATGATLAAAFLDAAFGYRLGRETYLPVRRVTVRAR